MRTLLPTVCRCFLVIFALATSNESFAQEAKPNIVLILTDDMGFSDLSCYGAEIPTPNLDGLAAQGVKFSQFYNATRCCPTRASLLTGLYAHRAGMGSMTRDSGSPGYLGRINENSTTISEVLHDAGYFTILTGKWHVGWQEGIHPWDRKFDRNLCIHKGGFHYSDQTGSRGSRAIYLGKEQVPKSDPRLRDDPNKEGFYATRLWTRYGLTFAKEAIDKEKPFFWFLSHTAPHFPVMAPKETVEKYRGKYMVGWDALRAGRLKRQRELGLIDKNWKLSERPSAVGEWDKLSADAKKDRDISMAIYAAMMDEVDRSVGQIVKFLKDNGEYENTLIIFLSDNGSSAEGGPSGRYRVKNAVRPGSGLSDIRVGDCWANLNNAPFRKTKKYSHEGGSATPMIVSWPQGIKANPNWVTTPGHVIDMLPTLVDIADGTYPKTRNGKGVHPADGVSLKPLLTGTGDLKPRPLYWEHQGNAAIRVGDRKLVREKGAEWELYDMSRDRTETSNLAATHPDEVRKLADQWTAWAKETGVLPKPPPRKRKKSKRK